MATGLAKEGGRPTIWLCNAGGGRGIGSGFDPGLNVVTVQIMAVPEVV